MPSAREWWSFGASVYLPSLLYGIGAGAVTPVIVLTARDLGASLATSSVLLAVMGAGKILGDIPAGALADRLGERMAMFVAGALTIGALFLCIHAESILALALGVGLLGAGSAVWGLARHAYLTQVMPFHLRGRALSTLGGTQRIGLFLGPFLGAAAIGPLGLRGAYWVHVVATALATLAGSVALFERGACRGGTRGLCWSDGGSEFVEGGGQPEQRGGVDCELVVAST